VRFRGGMTGTASENDYFDRSTYYLYHIYNANLPRHSLGFAAYRLTED
jgi:hypothetical protein